MTACLTWRFSLDSSAPTAWLHLVAACAWFFLTTLPTEAEIVLNNFSSNQPVKIMAIGDSITDDCVFNGAWRQHLQTLLTANGYPFTFVGRQASVPSGSFTKTLHEGYCGAVIAPPGMMSIPVHGYDGTNVYLLKIIAEALTNATPDLVLIAMGANDIGRGRDPYHVATNDLPSLLDLILSHCPNANIIVTKTTTLRDATLGYTCFATNVPIYNAAVQAVVNARRAEGQNVFFADMFSVVDYGTMFTSDHLHPNQAGLYMMAKEFVAHIQAITIRTNPVTATLIQGGADWKYRDTGEDPGTNWMQNGFDDSSWGNGVARLGYGDLVAATAIGFGPDPNNRYVTAYFRHAFVVPESVIYTNLDFRLTRVDGAVVWLNGTETFRVRMAPGPVTFTNTASSPMSGETAYIFYPAVIRTNATLPGTNLVAVEVHKSSPTNSMLGFDLELLGTGYAFPPPTLSVALTAGAIVVSWPLTNGLNFALYSQTNLAAAEGWTPVTSIPQTNGNSISVTLQPEGNQQFLRLQKRL